MQNKYLILGILIIAGVLSVYKFALLTKTDTKSPNSQTVTGVQDEGGLSDNEYPLSIKYMRNQEYPGSDIRIEQELPAGSNYRRYLTSYKSDGLKIFALLTIPNGPKPRNGWPVVIFNHGYIPPAEYRTTERYIAYTDAFSRNGYILFKPDYRGHGNSEGNPEGAYYSPAYTIDILNAMSSIRKLHDPEDNNVIITDSGHIGMWGHSLGGSVTLRSMVINRDIKAGVIWAGVVASYQDMAENWHRNRPWSPSARELTFRRPGRQTLIDKYGDFTNNPRFWESIAPISYVADIGGPIQIHHGTADTEVPILFSEKLATALKDAGKIAELYKYEGDDHNLSHNLNTALDRSVKFFDKYLKTEDNSK